MAILLTGGSGLLGEKLRRSFPNCLTPTHEELDITDFDKVTDYIKKNNVDQIIHTAALTSIRLCEEQKEEAWKTNVEGTRNLVQALDRSNPNGYFLYVSTACVFKGDEEMYSEESIPYPVNFYGITKLIGESIVQTLTNHLIIRTNFVGKKPWPYKKAFSDRFGNYLFVDDLAEAIKEIFESKLKGIVHIVGDRKLSMYELAKMTTPNIKSITMEEYSGPHLTMNMTLDSKRIKKYTISKM
jgi:dTDP-4-dehydrorhamnose reductase